MTKKILLLLTTASLYAQTDDILASIVKDKQYFSCVATVTKANESYKPYIISVFQGKELEKLGIKNLQEALEIVPGVDIATDNFDNKTAIFRGSNPSAYGQTQLFIDGVLVNNLFFDAYSEFLSMPIEMIKRVEVVRGPGSKIEGFNAYAGSINVITYAENFKGFKKEDRVVFKYGSYDYRMGGFVKHFSQGDFKTTIDFSYQKDNKSLYAGADGVSQGIFGDVNIPLSQDGDAPLWFEQYNLGVSVTYQNFYLKSRILSHTQGSAYGINLALPQKQDRVKLPDGYVEVGYNKKFQKKSLQLNAGVKYDAFDSKSKLAPDGLLLLNSEGDVVEFQDGIYGEHYAKQRTLYQATSFRCASVANHLITTGYRLSEEKTLKTTTKLSNRETGDGALVDYTDTLPFFDKNAKRDIYNFYIQDEFNYTKQISFMYGLNYEKTSYKDAGLEPRVSMVYAYNPNNIFKLIYSKSHRNPSWQEMFTMNNHARIGNVNLKPEKVTAYEFAYIKKFSNDVSLQSNLYYLVNKDQISNSPTNPLYRNLVNSDLYGFEVEYKGHIFSNDKLYVNYSYVDGDSLLKETDERVGLVNVAHNMAKAYYIYNLQYNISLSALVKYVGSKDRAENDERDKLKEYTTLDCSLHYTNTTHNYTLLLSAKNITNVNARYPSKPLSYEKDYAQDRRNFVITFTKEF